jgi:hypothetical protein
MLRIRSSPGTGGSEDEYQYLAEGVQSDGWLAIVMGYKASGAAALRSDMREPGGIKKGLRQLVDDPKAYEARMMGGLRIGSQVLIQMKIPTSNKVGRSGESMFS